MLGWCDCAVFEVWPGGGAGRGCISPGWHLLECGCSPSAQRVHGLGFSPGYMKLAVVFALVGESLLSMNGGKCTIHLCYLWESKVFNRTFELGLLLLGIWIVLPVVELLQRNKISVYFSAWCAEVRKGGYIKGAVLDTAKNKLPAGRKISAPHPPVFWFALPEMSKSLRVHCSWGRNHLMDCVSLGFWGAGGYYKLPKILTTLAEHILHTAETVSRTWTRKSNTKFLLSGYLIVVMFSFLEVIRAGLCSTETELAWSHCS